MIVQWHPGLGQRQLADCLGQTEASISRQVKLLHEKGLLTTEVDPAERRRHITKPSAKGVKITEAAREVLNTYQAPLLHGMTDKQQAQFLRTLTTLHERICAPGRPMICDQPFDIETVYASQQ